MLTLQEIFDRVVRHARKQGCKSLGMWKPGHPGACAYRGDGGTKCFMGALIPDEVYDPRIEGCSVPSSRGLINRILRDSGVDVITHAEPLAHLQKIHDRYAVKDWESAFQFFSQKYDLSLELPSNHTEVDCG